MNMKTFLLALIPSFVFAAPAEIRAGEPLPELRGEFLTGREVTLPQAAEGQVALLLLGFTYQSRFAVEDWAAKFRTRFQGDPRVTFYEVPIIGGLARLGKWFIDSGMRRGTPKADYEHVITVYRDTDDWKQRVSFGDSDAAYLILLDRNGRVAWQHQGAFDAPSFQSLSARVENLLESR